MSVLMIGISWVASSVVLTPLIGVILRSTLRDRAGARVISDTVEAYPEEQLKSGGVPLRSSVRLGSRAILTEAEPKLSHR